MEIPYNSTLRPDTGLYNGKLGIWLFLASEVMLFGGLFSAYVFLRTGSAEWHTWSAEAGLSVPIAFFNTLVLITSSVTMVMAWASLKRQLLSKARTYMVVTNVLAFVFLIVKSIEYSAKFSHHHYPSSNTFLAIYFTITGLHGLHVIGGIVVIGFLMGPGAKMWQSDPERYTNRVEIVGLYWHFVDLVWIFLFPVLYLL